jgi:hypothetical protein
MNGNHPTVNVLPTDLPPNRLALLLASYRERLQHPEPDDAPLWYLRGVLDVLEARLRDRAVPA